MKLVFQSCPPALSLWQRFLMFVQKLCLTLVVAAVGSFGMANAQLLSSECDIISFSWGNYEGVITDYGNNEYVIEVADIPHNTNISEIIPDIEISLGASIVPGLDESQDFAGSEFDPVIYIVTSEDGNFSKTYYVSFLVSPPTAEMLTMSFGSNSVNPDNFENVYDNVWFVTYSAGPAENIASLAPTYTLSFGATCDIPSGTTKDFTDAVEYTVYSSDGFSSAVYVVMVTKSEPILVNSGGTGELTFAKKPSASSWSTLSVAGTAGDITTVAGMDAAMSSIAGSTINAPLSSYAGLATAGAHWRWDLPALGTRPTGNKMTLLKSTLKNNSGTVLGGLNVSYELGAINTPAEQINGYRVYWSITGAAGSWTPAATQLQTSSGVSTANFTIEFSSGWGINQDLYVVWADDNGTGTQGIFTMDKISFTPIPPAANMLTFGLPGNPGVISGNEITITLPFTADFTALSPTFTMSYGAICDKASGSPHDFRQPVQYTVTSAGSTITKVYTVFIQPIDYWEYSAWTNDATSGIVVNGNYTVAANLGSTTEATVNNVRFEGVNSASGTRFTMGGTISAVGGRTNNVTSAGGGSATLASTHVFNGIPRTVTLSELTPGAIYETTFFSIGETNDQLTSDFSSGGQVLRLNPNAYGNGNGIKIIHHFIATASTRSFTIAPTGSATFRLYALANRMSDNPSAAATTTELVSSSNPSGAGQNVTFTATLKVGGNVATAATGSYTFRRNGILLAVVPVNNGVAAYSTNTLEPGSQTISASYSSDLVYRSSQASIEQVDNTPIILTVNGGTGSGTYLGGATVTIAANSPAQGMIFHRWVINSGTAAIADENSAYTTLTIASGNVTITATYGGAALGGITPLAWYDANDATSITTVNGNQVSQWNDLSGSGRHVSQAVSASQPTIGSSTITFDGTGDFLTHNAAFMYAAGSVDVYIVGAMSGATDRRIIAENLSTSGNPLYCLAQSSSTQVGVMASYIRNDASAVRLSNDKRVSTSSALDRTDTKIYLWQDTGSKVSGRVNGGDPLSQAYTRSGAITLNRFNIGAIGPRPGSTSGSFYMNAGINEVVITSNLSNADRQKIEGYLAWKWDGIRGNNLLVSALPDGHLYKTAAPVMNTPPVAIAQNVSVPFDTPTPITLNGYDPNGNTVNYTNAIVSGPSHGTLSGTAPNLTYTPDIGYSGSDSFTFKVNDGTVDSIPATVSITVAEGDSYVMWENSYNLTGGLTGDDDGDGVSNFNEFAFGLNPTSGASSNPIVVPFNKATHAFTYTRYAYSNLAYTVWTSTDLQYWGETPVPVTEVVSEPDVNGVVSVQTTLDLPPVNASKLFIRVKAE